MQVKIDDEILYEIDTRMLAVFGNEVIDPISDIKRCLQWIIQQRHDVFSEKLIKEWTSIDEAGTSKLSRLGVSSIPTNKNDLIDLILTRPEYKDKATRVAELTPPEED